MESSEGVAQYALPKETRTIAEKHPIPPQEQATTNQELITNRQESATRQREFLDNLSISTVNEVLEPYTQTVNNLLNNAEALGPQPNDPTVNLLKHTFPTEDGYNVGQYETDSSVKYIVTKKGENGLSNSVTILSNPLDNKESTGFVIEQQIFLNEKTNKAFDMTREIQDGGYKTYFTIIKNQDYSGGQENLAGGFVEIHIGSNKGKEDLPQMGGHELGHTFQDPIALKNDFLYSYVTAFTEPLTHFLPQAEGHIFPKLKTIRRYQEAVGKNLQERNADAFAVALFKKLRDLGVNILTNKQMEQQLNQRKTERIESPSYTPQ